MRFLACVLLVIAATHATEAKTINDQGTCVPNKAFPYYCNTCVCGRDGLVTNAACTWMNCEPGMWNRDGTPNNSPGLPESAGLETCTPGESFLYYCNDCFCRPDGLVRNAGCTRIFCDLTKWNKDGSRKNPAAVVKTRDTCVLGKSFRFYCATCTCGDDGLVNDALCPFALCDREVWHKNGTRKSFEEDKTCVPGEAFSHYCNGCICGSDGLVDRSVCTNMRCGDKWNKDGTLKNSPAVVKTEETCVPGESFSKYCNGCLCGSDGLVANAVCTNMRCGDGVWNKDGTLKNSPAPVKPEDACVPGESFSKYCNGCLCGEDGLIANAVCTNMRCGDRWNKDGTLKSSPAPVKPEDACVPGESFPKYCVTCSCGEDGLVENALCPFMLCDENEFNRDGTRKAPIGNRMGGDSVKSGGTTKSPNNGQWSWGVAE